jgi:hypothetical protein
MSKATVSVVLVLPRIRVGLPRAAPPTPAPLTAGLRLSARTYLRRRTWRGARRDRRAPHACQYFTRTSAAHPRSRPGVGPGGAWHD